eukprot:gnl/TRDRNA2_/TRDRNA2_136064_c0_seq3.p1 gnl/TRDRNA2_/TRDRNA2_136064_c0~~gnl/TRDRNA2_/TRDRNA2_136064_c0_seq3.p1  ORF type:complete len:125 (-),score=24.86 gnl/TRDRNA2_/TRDRNA2_136064_c0_seq3:396-770(-)
MGLHFVFWMINSAVFLTPGISDIHHRRAVFLLSSQKTLPVSLAIIAGLQEDSFGQPGLLALPCIFGHLAQLIIDSFLVSFWAKHPHEISEVEECNDGADEFGADSEVDTGQVVRDAAGQKKDEG